MTVELKDKINEIANSGFCGICVHQRILKRYGLWTKDKCLCDSDVCFNSLCIYFLHDTVKLFARKDDILEAAKKLMKIHKDYWSDIELEEKLLKKEMKLIEMSWSGGVIVSKNIKGKRLEVNEVSVVLQNGEIILSNDEIE